VIRVGCCGWRKSHDTTFAHLQLLEVQRTFYKPPMVRTARRWREEAPSDFVFTLKVWQLIPHEPSSPTYRKADLDVPDEAADRYGSFRPTTRTLEIADVLVAPLVVFQCPASFEPTVQHKENVRAFFESADRDGVTFAWEPRGEWGKDEIATLCHDLDLVHCIDPFESETVTGDPACFRPHGIDGYYHNYSDEELDELRARCDPFETAYALFNNVSMWEDALRFRELLGQT